MWSGTQGGGGTPRDGDGGSTAGSQGSPRGLDRLASMRLKDHRARHAQQLAQVEEQAARGRRAAKKRAATAVAQRRVKISQSTFTH